MSRFSFRNLHSCNSQSLIRSSCLRVSSSIIIRLESMLLLRAAKQASRGDNGTSTTYAP
jgi:hypothetical protein